MLASIHWEADDRYVEVTVAAEAPNAVAESRVARPSPRMLSRPNRSAFYGSWHTSLDNVGPYRAVRRASLRGGCSGGRRSAAAGQNHRARWVGPDNGSQLYSNRRGSDI
jgi:hypothetical protein